MSEILILIQAHVAQRVRHKFKDSSTELVRMLSQVMGYQGFSAWESASKAGEMFIALEYVDVESAERGLEAWVEFMPTLKQHVPFDSTPNVMRICTKRRVGRHLVSAPNDSCMSFSHRVSEPGREAELIADVDMVLDGMSLMDGFQSGVYGENDTLSEEIVCVVTWSNEAAYAASVPPRDPDYSLALFRRVA